MTDQTQTPCSPVRLVMGTVAPDGSAVTRSWTICSCQATHLANALGTPDAETLADASAVAEVARRVDSTPGVVRTGRGL